MNQMRFRFVLVSLFCVVVLSHCTPKKIASDITSQLFLGGSPSFEAESDLYVGESAGLPLLKVIEALSYDNPKNKNYTMLLARSYSNFAFAFLEWNMLKSKDVDSAVYEANAQRAKLFYMRGKLYGLKLLNKGSFKRALNGGDLDSFKKSLRSFHKKDVPALFWTAMSWGGWVNLSRDNPMAIAEFPKVEAMMNRVVELDESYFYGSPDLFFGVSFGSRPAMFGGNPAKSKEFFEKGIQITQRKFLMGLVMYAQAYAIQNQDKELFEKLLNEVLAAKADDLAEQRLANEMAKARARFLLDHEATYF